MKTLRLAGLTLLLALSTTANAEQNNTWYAGTTHQGVVLTLGLAWHCSGGACVLRGPYGNGLNMQVCKELSRKVGGLDYYYNDTGMVWSETENRALLAQCNSR